MLVKRVCLILIFAPCLRNPAASCLPLQLLIFVLSTITFVFCYTVLHQLILKDRKSTKLSMLNKLNRCQWWLVVTLNILFLIGGQTAAVLLGRFYYDKGGSSVFLATIVQTAGFPILFIPLHLLRSSPEPPPTSRPLSLKYISLIYITLGIVLAGDSLLYSVGLLYLSASTYSLICATQLAFNAVFSFFINSQKFTALVINSVAVLSFSASLLAVSDDPDTPSGVTKRQYIIGFLCTLGASGLYSLLLSLTQLTFEKGLKRQTFSVVIEMLIFTSVVATVVSTAGLFISGEWRGLGSEMERFGTGKASYVLTVVWTAVVWQVCSVGVVGLIFLVSSLFSNVIGTLARVVAQIASVVVFHDRMDGVKVIAMLLALWGFASYFYQNYLDESKMTRSQPQTDALESPSDRCLWRAVGDSSATQEVELGVHGPSGTSEDVTT